MKTQMINNIKSLIASTSIPASLVRAVIRQFGGWESFTSCASDVCRCGIDGGFHGFIYNKDTEAFAKRNREAISEMASVQASDFGMGVMEMIRGFGCFRSYQNKPTDEEIGMALYAGKEPENSTPVLNALAWYAGEEVCRAYVDACEQ